MKLNMKLKNLTTHDINIQIAGTDELFCIKPSSIVARCKTEYTTVEQVTCGGDTFNIRERYFNEPTDLPEPQDGVLYIVSRIVAEACADVRTDLLMVDETMRDSDGRIIGCKAFARWPVKDTKPKTVAESRESWWGQDATRILDYIEMNRGNMSDFEVLEDIMCGSYVDGEVSA